MVLSVSNASRFTAQHQACQITCKNTQGRLGFGAVNVREAFHIRLITNATWINIWASAIRVRNVANDSMTDLH